MGNKKSRPSRRQNMRDAILEYILECSKQNGYSPSYREIGEAVGLKSIATVSRYVHWLMDEGVISRPKSSRRTLTVPRNTGSYETICQRICMEVADGGRVYVDCHLKKPRDVQVRVSFTGILDAESLKGKVGQVIHCSACRE